MENEIIALALDDTFKFSCSSEVACFNECCKDLNQFLTPYDIMRLKNHLGLKSNIFLERYTTQHIGPETGLPVIVLRLDPKSDLKCPFVTPDGCTVYKDRPSSCRTYPLARLAYRNRETGKIDEQYVMLEEPHCFGRNQEKTQTVRQWIKEQGIEVYNEMNDMLMEIIALKNQLHPQALDLKERHLFHMACYDLDTFKTQIFENNLLDNMDIDEKTLEAAKTDDTELLKIGLKWIKHALFD